jgi:hypothetical protein
MQLQVQGCSAWCELGHCALVLDISRDVAVVQAQPVGTACGFVCMQSRARCAGCHMWRAARFVSTVHRS